MKKVDSKSFKEGLRAYENGCSRSTNPYGDMGDDAQQWLDGWLSCQLWRNVKDLAYERD